MVNKLTWSIRASIFLVLATVIFHAASPACGASVAPGAKPNIIFIMADDLGYGEVGCYGQTRIKTPALDQMAAQGNRFTSFYAGAPVCAPARCTLLTGYHTGHSFIRGNGNPPLPPDPPTLGLLLKGAGYATGCIGKWGMGAVGSAGSPSSHGFDEFVGFIGQTAAHNQYPDTLYRGDKTWRLPEGTYANDVFTSEALSFITRHSQQSFFLYLPYTIPHQKLVVPSQGIYAKEDWPDPEKNKAAMITRMDTGIALIREELRRLGLDKNTIILFTSDNGPHKEDGTDPSFFSSSGPLRGIKRDLTEGGIRVPMIVTWPGTVKAGTVSDAPWAMWDVLPTLLDVAGTADTYTGHRDGVSMKAALTDGAAVEHGPLYWEFYEHGFAQAVRQGDWKLLKTTTGSLELYNLPKDPGEAQNLAASRADLVLDMMPLLTTMRTESAYWHPRFAGGKTKGKDPATVKPKRGKKRK